MTGSETESLRTRTAAFLFWDTVGSTAMLARLGERRNEEVRRRLFDVVREVIAANRGEEVKNLGDGQMVAFPLALGDSLSCGIGIQRAVAVLNGQFPDVELAVRVGIAAGDAVLDPAEEDWFGRAVNTAARLCGAAQTSEILATAALGELTDWRVEPIGPLGLKGLPDPVDTVRVSWALAEGSSIAALPPVLQLGEGLALAGRRDEIAQLDESLARARRGEPVRVRIAGPVGCGVTRLTREWLHRCGLGAQSVLGASCVDREAFDAVAAAVDWHAGCWPELLRSDAPEGLVPLVAAVAPAVARLSGTAATQAPLADVESALVSYVRLMAVPGPVIVVLDDCAERHHLAMDELAARLDGLPALIISAGPADDPEDADIAVHPLTPDEVTEIVSSQLPLDDRLVAASAAMITAETGGVALQVCEVVNALARERSSPATPEDARAAVASAITLSCPYRGLSSLGTDDHSLFFGRDAVLAELVGAVRRSQITVVSGMSGSGKSSLLAAGLFPALQLGTAGAYTMTCPVLVTPGSDPNGMLADFLADHLDETSDTAGQGSSANGVVLIVDQFEEIWTHGLDEHERDRFIDRLVALGSTGDRYVRVVLGLRSDFLGQAVQHDRLRSALRDSQVLVGTPDVDELRRMILGPAETTGFALEDGLVERVISDVTGETGALPLLSHALYETWRRRQGRMLTLAGYESCGGIEGAISATAESVVGDMSAAQLDDARHLFNRLVTLGEGRADTRRRARLDELTTASRDAAAPFVEARLLTSGDETLEISHEALLQHWPRLVRWLSEDRDDLRILRGLAVAAAEWEAGDRNVSDLYRGSRLEAAVGVSQRRPSALNGTERAFLDAGQEHATALAQRDRRRRATMRSAVVGLAALLVVAVIAAVLAIAQWRRAEDETATARARQREAELAAIVSRAIQLADAEPAVAHTLAIEAYRRDPGAASQRALLEVLAARKDLAVVRGPPFEPTECDGTRSVTDSELQYAQGLDVTSVNLVDGTSRWIGTRPHPCAKGHIELAPGSLSNAFRGSQVWLADDPSTVAGWGEPIETPGEIFSALSDESGILLFVVPDDGTSGGPYRPGNYYWVGADRRMVPLHTEGRASPVGGYLWGQGLAFLPVSETHGVTGRLVDVATGEHLGAVDLDAQVRTVASSGNGERFAALLSDSVRIFSSETLDEVATLPESLLADGIDLLSLDEAGDEVAVLSRGTVGIFSIETGELTRPRLDVDGAPLGMWLEDHRVRLLYPDGTIQLLAPGSSPLEVSRHSYPPARRIDLNRDGTVAAGVHAEGMAAFRTDLETGTVETLELPPELGTVVAAIPIDATRTALIASDTRVAIVEGGVLVDELPPIDENLVVAAGDGSGVTGSAAIVAKKPRSAEYTLWVTGFDPLATTTEPLSIEMQGTEASGRFAPRAIPRSGGGMVVVNPASGNVEFYDGALELEWSTSYATAEPGAAHQAVDLSVDDTGDALLFVTEDQTVQLARVDEPEVRAIDTGGRALTAALSPDGTRLVVTDEGGITTLWDTATATELGPIGPVAGLATAEPRWSPDGSSVTLIGSDEFARFETDPQRWVSIACELIANPPDRQTWETHAPPGIERPSDCSTG